MFITYSSAVKYFTVSKLTNESVARSCLEIATARNMMRKRIKILRDIPKSKKNMLLFSVSLNLPLVIRSNNGLSEFLSLQCKDDRPHDIDPYRIENHNCQWGIAIVSGKHDAHDQAFCHGRDEP